MQIFNTLTHKKEKHFVYKNIVYCIYIEYTVPLVFTLTLLIKQIYLKLIALCSAPLIFGRYYVSIQYMDI